jgi:hypothetical protein
VTTKVEKNIIVDVPVSTAYNQWTQFEEFPRFMGGVQRVEQLDDTRLHWVAEIAGVKREWNAEILEQRPDEKVAWAATEGATNAGAVYFAPIGLSRCEVRLELEYEPEGMVEKVGDMLDIVERRAEADLEKFKGFIEAKGTESGAWRGEVAGSTTGTPGVEEATSQGDSGKAGISGKAAVAGAAAAAAGVAAAAAAVGRSGSGSTEGETDEVEEVVEVVPAPEVDAVETTYAEGTVPPAADDVVLDDPTDPTGRPSSPGAL